MKYSIKSGFMKILMAIIAIVTGLTLLYSRETPRAKISAKLECSYEAEDGTSYRFPGNGSKAKPRIDGPINCWIAVKGITDDDVMKGRLKAKGKLQEPDVIPRPDDSYSADASFSPENGDFESCMSFTVTGELVRKGKTVWKGKINIDQLCHD